MTFTEFNNEIKKRLERVSHNEKLEFALNICKKLYPDYEKFHRKHAWGDPKCLIEGIRFCEHVRIDSNFDLHQLKALKQSIEKATPDTEDYGDFDGSYALNASAAILETLEFIEGKTIEHILNVSSLMNDTVDFKINETFGKLSDDEIDAHAWMIKQRNYQIDLTNNNRNNEVISGN